MIEKINNSTAASATQTATSAKGELKPDAKVQIFEGMTVKDVQENGSEAQKIVAEAFDRIDSRHSNGKGDGKFSKAEAEVFNNYTFTLDKNTKELRAYNKETGCTVTVKYNNLEELKDKALIPVANELKGGNVTFDLRNKTATYDGVSCDKTFILPERKNLKNYTIKNSDLEEIDARFLKDGNIKIMNTKQLGNLWDSPTTVKVYDGNDTTVSADNTSDIKIKKQSHH